MNNLMFNFVYILFRPLFWLLYPMKVYGKKELPEGALLICASHSAMTDPFFLCYSLGLKYYVHFMAKDELRKVPVVGWALSKAGMFFVRRGERDVGAIKNCMRALKAGERIAIFPEGTRVKSDDDSDAKTGVIHLAAKLNVPILPINIPREKKLFRRVKIIIGEPYYVQVGKHDDYESLSRDLMARISALEALEDE